MAEEQHKSPECETPNNVAVETTDRGMFDFLGKKSQEEVIVTEFENVHVSKIEETKDKEKKPSLMEKLHRSHHSSSSSSSDEEEKGGGEKKKKKKGLKEKISKGEKKIEHENTSVPIDKCHEVVYGDATPQGEKKSFLEKIKEKLPGQHKKAEEGTPVPHPAECATYGHHVHEGEAKEKKGIMEKIKEKLPGCHKSTGEEKEKEKEKEKESGCH